jgi:hypothetical protein
MAINDKDGNGIDDTIDMILKAIAGGLIAFIINVVGKKIKEYLKDKFPWLYEAKDKKDNKLNEAV